MQEFCFNLL